MNVIIRIALAAVLSSFAATAQAAPLARAIDGTLVELSADRATTVVFWSLDCAACVETMSRLEQAAIPYVAVNTDAANTTSQLRAFARTHRVSAPIVADCDGRIQLMLLAKPEQAVTIGPSGSIAWRGSSHDAETLLLLASTDVAEK